MKRILSLIFLLSTILVYSQENLDVKISNVKLWEKEYKISFSYPSDDLPIDEFHSPNLNLTLEQNLDILANTLGLEYRIMGNNVLLRSNVEAELLPSQEKGDYKLSGRIVLDSDTRGLEWVAVSIDGSDLGTFSDKEGYFQLLVPAQMKDRLVTVHHLGYEDVAYSIQEMDGQLFVIELQPSDLRLDLVTIVSDKKSLTVSNSGFYQLDDLEQWKFKGSIAGSDLLRQIQMLPGVNATNDLSVDVEVRGAESYQTLIILDGMPLYRVGHYYGLFSAINSDFVERVRLHKNYFPLQYGGTTAGVLEIFSEEKSLRDFSGRVDFNLLTGSIQSVIPFSERISLNVAGRTSWSNISNGQFYSQTSSFMNNEILEDLESDTKLSKSDPQANFCDLNSSLKFLVGDKSQLTLNGFYSEDQMLTNFEITQSDKKNREVFSLFRDNESWSNTASSLIFESELHTNLTLTSRAYYSNYSTDYANETLIEVTPDNNQPGPSEQNETFSMVSHSNEITDLGFVAYVDKEWDTNTFRIGASLINHSLDYNFIADQATILDGKDKFTEYALFSNTQFKLNKMSINLGLRGEYHTIADSRLFISPRAALHYQQNEKLSFKASYGYFQQCFRSISYDFQGISKDLWIGSNSEIPVLTSSNFMVGSTWINKLFTIDLEIYRKNLSEMLEFAALMPGAGPRNGRREYDIFRGNGYTQGLDVMLSSSFNSFESYLCYTLSKSEERYKPIDNGNYFPSENDRRHQLKFLNKYSFSNLTVNLDFIYGSGRPYVDIENLGQEGDIRNEDPSSRFENLDDFKRWDLGLAYDFKFTNSTLSLSAGILNLFNSENVRYNQIISTNFDDNSGSGPPNPTNIVVGNESRLLGRIYNFSVGFSF